MKRLLIVLTMAAMLFWSAEVVQAMVFDVPFVSISITPNVLNLGTMLFASDFFESPGKLTVEVESNCYHGPITVSITDLKHDSGCRIPANRICVKTPATGGFVSMAKPVVISEPTEGSHNFVMNFQVDNRFEMRHAGEYTGTIIFTIMPLARP